MVGTLKAARAAALNDAYISPFAELDLANATHSASMAPLVFAANDTRAGEAAAASWSLSCGCGCGKGWTSFFRDGVGDRVRVAGVDTVTNPLLLDTIGGDSPGTAQAIAVGSTTYGVIEDFNDQDFFSVTLVAGQTYAISQLLHVGGTATGDGTLLSGVPLADAYIELYGADGTTLLAEADGGSNTTPSGLDAKLFFTATETGTYFINARSFDQDPTNGTDGDHVGDYKLTVQEVAAADAPLPRFYSAAGQAPNPLLDSLDWGSTWDHTVRNPDGDNGTRTDNGVANGGTPITNTEYGIVGKNVMKVYFAKQGDVFLSEDPANPGLETTLQAREMLQWEKDAFRATMGIYEQVTDLKYVEVDNRADADIKIIIYQGTPGAGASLLGRMSPPGEQNEGQTEINAGDYRWTEEGVSQGGFFFPTLLHEWGHGHGMKHPHDTGGGGPVMRGAEPSEDPVEGAIGGQYGDFGLSQQMYTIMSYNDGWNETGGVGGRPAGHGGPSSGGLEMQADHYGWMGTLAALDIALLQDKYGVNEEWATGDDVYTIEDTNGAGHYYSTIWDGGGNDEIRYVGSRDATIDLRAATLQYEEGGGGRVSFAMGAWTGFTIANGVDIERATGGDGNDILTGNAVTNTLVGGEGADRLDAGAGVAGEFQYLFGEGGDDTYVYGSESGLVYIGSRGEGAATGAADRVVFSDLDASDVILGHQDYRDSYPVEGLAMMIMWQNGEASGQLQIANGARDIESFQFADGAVFNTLQLTPQSGGTYSSTGAGASADLIFGGAGTDRLYGGEGADLLNAGAGVAGEFQYLFGEGGDDTYVYGTESGLAYIGSGGEGATSGTADRVVFTDLNAGDVTIAYQDYRDSYPSEGLAMMIMWQNDQGSGQLQIANGGRDIESFQFADGSVFTAQQLAALTPAGNQAAAQPQVLPGEARDKTAPQPEVLPGSTGDKAAFDGPQTLPGVDDGAPSLVRDGFGSTDFGTRDGDTEETLSLFDVPADDGYLFAAMKDGGWPEVLPAMDDGFVLTGKFDDAPPVMPTATDIFDIGAPSITEMEMARELLMSLARENPFNTAGDSLTLTEDWSDFAPHRDAMWA